MVMTLDSRTGGENAQWSEFWRLRRSVPDSREYGLGKAFKVRRWAVPKGTGDTTGMHWEPDLVYMMEVGNKAEETDRHAYQGGLCMKVQDLGP